jgi:penicillin-binding protein 2
VIEHPQLPRRTPVPPQLTRRVGVLGVIAFALFGIIAFRLWYLEVLTGPQNVAVANANVERRRARDDARRRRGRDHRR